MPLTLDEYQKTCKDTRAYKDYGQGTIGPVSYCVLGLCGEAGETANKIKKVLRGDYILDALAIDQILDELGDVLWYTAMLADELNADLSVVAMKNLNKLRLRKNMNTIKGTGDKR
jgi:NTP pyrophosphatase (non-canonical NTP hydrolase)